ncbi:MAG: hypothetical protein V4759_11370 [Pseudomonadota bacterium]
MGLLLVETGLWNGGAAGDQRRRENPQTSSVTSYLQAKGLNVRVILEIAHFLETSSDSRLPILAVRNESSMTHWGSKTQDSQAMAA